MTTESHSDATPMHHDLAISKAADLITRISEIGGRISLIKLNAPKDDFGNPILTAEERKTKRQLHRIADRHTLRLLRLRNGNPKLENAVGVEIRTMPWESFHLFSDNLVHIFVPSTESLGKIHDIQISLLDLVEAGAQDSIEAVRIIGKYKPTLDSVGHAGKRTAEELRRVCVEEERAADRMSVYSLGQLGAIKNILEHKAVSLTRHF